MTKSSSKYKKLSKYLSYILRHHPEEASISIDEEGFTELEDILKAIKQTKYSWASKEDIIDLIENSGKKRFEIEDGKIRALYGHSIDVEIKEETKPPEILYHGTSPDALSSIFKDGLKPMGRQYVHLSVSKEEAEEVGKRHHPSPIILEIKARSAWKNGVSFYERGDLYISEEISEEYFELSD